MIEIGIQLVEKWRRFHKTSLHYDSHNSMLHTEMKQDFVSANLGTHKYMSLLAKLSPQACLDIGCSRHQCKLLKQMSLLTKL